VQKSAAPKNHYFKTLKFDFIKNPFALTNGFYDKILSYQILTFSGAMNIPSFSLISKA
jgi:hypothetical protein